MKPEGLKLNQELKLLVVATQIGSIGKKRGKTGGGGGK
jgi:hypothetical protein